MLNDIFSFIIKLDCINPSFQDLRRKSLNALHRLRQLCTECPNADGSFYTNARSAFHRSVRESKQQFNSDVAEELIARGNSEGVTVLFSACKPRLNVNERTTEMAPILKN